MNRSSDRKERMEKMFEDLELSYERVVAIDGNKIIQKEPRLSQYEEATTLSHLRAIETFYKSGEEYGIICEDDMSLEFLPLWKKSITDVINEAPKDWQILELGYIIWPHNYPYLTKLYTPFIPIIFNSAIAYLIKRSTAEIILSKHSVGQPNLDKYLKIRPVADVLIFDIVKTYTYKYSLFTYPDNNTSTIHNNHLDFHIQSKVEARKMFDK
jgi:GR25 family glycosyltransferase involved in LPS biosynthesis